MLVYKFVKQADQISLTEEISAVLDGVVEAVSVSDSLISVSTSIKLSKRQENQLRSVITLHDSLARINVNAIDDRIAWGQNVIRQFRRVTLSVPDDQGLVFLENLLDIKTTLELGMLVTSAFLLESKPPDPILDSLLPSGLTIRQRFLNMILKEGPTP